MLVLTEQLGSGDRVQFKISTKHLSTNEKESAKCLSCVSKLKDSDLNDLSYFFSFTKSTTSHMSVDIYRCLQEKMSLLREWPTFSDYPRALILA